MRTRVAQRYKAVFLLRTCFNLFLLTLAFLWSVYPVFAQKQMAQAAKATSDGRYIIALLVSSPASKKSLKVEAIKHGAQLRVEAINKAGGLDGRGVRLLILDDHKDAKNTIKNVRQALAEPRLIAMLGLDSSTRGAKVIEAIGKSGVPFISDISLDSLFAAHKNIFSMTSSISGDAEVMTRFLGENYKRVVFVGRQDELFAKEFHGALTKQSKVSLDAVHWLPREASEFASKADQAIAEIKALQPDILCVSVFSHQGAEFVKRLRAANLDLPIYFGTGSLHSVLRKTAEIDYKGSLFGIGRGIPDVESERRAPSGQQDEFAEMRRLYPDYLGNGIIYSDLVSLIATAAIAPSSAKSAADNNIETLRGDIVSALQKYRQGRQSFHGEWRNWSFSKTRSSALSSFVLWAPDGGPKLQLWPTQHVRTLAGLQKAPVAFVNVDLVGIDHIDTNNLQFNAEFYLSLSGATDIEIGDMKFSNVVQGENGEQFLSVREMHKGRSDRGGSAQVSVGEQGAATAPTGREWINRLYLVKGKFLFNPQLAQYPFDSQRFAISIEPKNTTSPFLIQPNASTILNNGARIEGWRLRSGKSGEYVGYEENDIIVVRDYGADQQTMPYYRFNFSWVAKRVTKDYFMRVVIPLVLILMVAYLSVFLPTEKIDSIVAMKVTALLSTVALYFSIPKLETETATLSDQIFVFSELIIVVMVFISIVRVHATLKKTPIIGGLLFAMEVVVFPVSAFLMFRYVMAVSEGKINSVTEETFASMFAKLVPHLY